MAEKNANPTQEEASKVEAPKIKVEVPTIEQLLAAGVQFGHEKRRWHPKMQKYIFTHKDNIHVIDLEQTSEALQKAAEVLGQAAARGNVLFVATKRQASKIVKEEAIRAGAYFVNERWAGGLLTNFSKIKESLIKLKNLEKGFEEGVQGRTKFEVSRMKKEWARLDRLYSGVKQMEAKPTAAVVIDAKFEKGAIRECKRLGIPVIALVDTNTDPDTVDYVIPANDDAISSIQILISTLADAVIAGNKGNGIKHNLKDYSKVEVEIIKVDDEVADEKAEVAAGESTRTEERATTPTKGKKATGRGGKGILEKVQESKEKKGTKAKK